VHLIQIRGAEKPHRHLYHDAVVFLESGQGTLYLGKNVLKLQAGSVIFIEHGTPHYFVNQGPEPAVAVAVFSPPYDGQDLIEVQMPR
jgi:quercetin dioxygenase-like cupin family protein